MHNRAQVFHWARSEAVARNAQLAFDDRKVHDGIVFYSGTARRELAIENRLKCGSHGFFPSA
jgi:hypothetical protein